MLLCLRCRGSYWCFYVLLNLAENRDLEGKMVNRKLITFLCPLLTRETKELVHVVVEFLRKLSVTVEYRASIAGENIIPALANLVLDERQPELLQKVRRRLGVWGR